MTYVEEIQCGRRGGYRVDGRVVEYGAHEFARPQAIGEGIIQTRSDGIAGCMAVPLSEDVVRQHHLLVLALRKNVQQIRQNPERAQIQQVQLCRFEIVHIEVVLCGQDLLYTFRTRAVRGESMNVVGTRLAHGVVVGREAEVSVGVDLYSQRLLR